NTEYDRYYSDPRVKPNPNLGPLEKGPFQAFQIVPGDLGTKGGLLTDEHARVIDTKGKVIPGLYAAGNTTASVMGRTYPGAGATIGPATAFGYPGARHAATRRNGAAQACPSPPPPGPAPSRCPHGSCERPCGHRPVRGGSRCWGGSLWGRVPVQAGSRCWGGSRSRRGPGAGEGPCGGRVPVRDGSPFKDEIQ